MRLFGSKRFELLKFRVLAGTKQRSSPALSGVGKVQADPARQNAKPRASCRPRDQFFLMTFRPIKYRVRLISCFVEDSNHQVLRLPHSPPTIITPPNIVAAG